MKYVQIYLNQEKEYCILPSMILDSLLYRDYDVIEVYKSEDEIFEKVFPNDNMSESALLDLLF